MHHPIGIILTSVDDASIAKKLAHDLIRERLAACVQISGAGTSVYHWDEAVQESDEYYLSIKAPLNHQDAIIRWLELHHPYDTPEIIAFEAQAAQAYANWVERVATV